MPKGIQASDVRWATVRSLVAALATVGSAVLIARGLAPDAAGRYQFAEMLVVTGATLVNAGKADTGLRFVAAVDAPVGARIARDLLGLCLLPGLLLLVACCLAGAIGWRPLELDGLGWLGLAAAAGGLHLVLFGLLQGWGEYRKLALSQSVILPGKLLAGGLVLLAGGSLFGLLAVLVASQVLGALALLAVAIPRLRQAAPAVEGDLARRLRRYRWQMTLIILLTLVVWDRSEFYFLAHYATPQAVAFYGAAFHLATFAMRMLPGLVSGLLTPGAARLRDDAGAVADLYRDGTRYLFAVAWPLALVGSCFAGTVMGVVYGQAYLPAAAALPPLLFGAGAGAVAAAEASVKFGLERPDLLLKVGLGAAAVNLTLDWLLIPHYGWQGAAWANAVAQLGSVTAGAVITCRMFAIRFPWGSIGRAALAGLALVPLWLAIDRQDLGVAGLGLGALSLLVLYPLLLVASGFLKPRDWERWRTLWRLRPVASPRRHHAHRD